jgi:hypothetical protein
VLLNMLVSASLLYAAGINYTSPGGSPFAKLHPGTYLAMLAFALVLWERHAPLATLREYWRRERAIMCFILSLLWCVLLALIVNGPTGTAVYIESFAPAAILVLILGRAPQATLRRLGYAMLALFALNVAIALIETTLHQRLIPLYLGGDALTKEFKVDFRATGLWDHPLTGSSMTMIAMVLIMAMPLALAWRAALALLFLAGLISFGGRTALALTVVTLAGYGCTWFARQVVSRRLRPWHLAAVVITMLVVPAFIWAVATQTSAGERLMAHMYWDDSAQNRAVQFQVLSNMTPRELLFGTSFDRIGQIIYQIGLSVPFDEIEDFWLVIMVQVGIFGFIGFAAGFLVFVARVWNFSSTPGRVILVLVLLIASTSNSLGRKSNLLTIAVATILVANAFRRPMPQVAPRASVLARQGPVFAGPAIPPQSSRSQLQIRRQ